MKEVRSITMGRDKNKCIKNKIKLLLLLLLGVMFYADTHAGLYRLSRLKTLPRSRIVNPCNGGTVHFRLEWMLHFKLTTAPLDRPNA